MNRYAGLTALLLYVLAITPGCKKENPDQSRDNPPAATAQMTRNFYYPSTGTNNNASYNSGSDSTIIEGCRLTDAGELVIYFEVPFSKGTDNTSFTILPANIKSGYTGEYTIIPIEKQGDVKVQYSYALSASSANIYIPGTADGKLVISKYDARYKTLSGTYHFFINSRQDPTVVSINNFMETKITVSGSFENIAIK